MARSRLRHRSHHSHRERRLFRNIGEAASNTVPFIAVAGMIAALFLMGCSGNNSAPPFVPGAPSSSWGIFYSPGMPAGLDGNNSFAFPQPPGSVHYVLRHVSPGGNRIRMRFRIDGDGPFISTQDGGPGHVTLFIQRAGDDLTAAKPSYRFWAGTQVLSPGEYTIDVPFAPQLWGNVFGQNDPDGFTAAVNDLANVGFTFGNPGAGATGHGVHVTGSATFTLLEYTIE